MKQHFHWIWIQWCNILSMYRMTLIVVCLQQKTVELKKQSVSRTTHSHDTNDSLRGTLYFSHRFVVSDWSYTALCFPGDIINFAHRTSTLIIIYLKCTWTINAPRLGKKRWMTKCWHFLQEYRWQMSILEDEKKKSNRSIYFVFVCVCARVFHKNWRDPDCQSVLQPRTDIR